MRSAIGTTIIIPSIPNHGRRLEHGSPVAEIAGVHEVEAAAAASIQPCDKLRRTPTRSMLTVALMRDWKTAWSCTGS